MRLKSLCAPLAALVAVCPAAWSQTAPVNGMRPADLRAHVITDATVVTAPSRTIEGATIIIRDGVIEAVGTGLPIPDDARVWPGEGLTVYPGLIESALLVEDWTVPPSPGAHWNGRVHPQVTMAHQDAPNQKTREELRALGFTCAAVYPSRGAWRGSGVVVALAEESRDALIYQNRAMMAAGFDYGGRGGGDYPGSLMGAIALLRQTLYDAQWYEACQRVWREHPEGNEPPARADALAALIDVINGEQEVLFEVSDELNALRAARIARAFDLEMTLLGSGWEFRRLDEIVGTGLPIIVPLNYPKRPDVTTLAAADRATLRDLAGWEQAPTNPRRLVDAGATITLTTHGLKKRGDFLKRMREAVRHGLSEEAALAAVTTTPAQMLGVSHLVGTIEAGKAANLVVVDGTLFDKKPTIRDTWINGRRYEINAEPRITLAGTGRLRTSTGLETNVTINSKKSSFSLTLPDDKTVKAKKMSFKAGQLSCLLDGKLFNVEGYVHLSGVLTDSSVIGNGLLPDGQRFTFSIDILDEALDEDDDETMAASDDEDSEDTEEGISGEWTAVMASERMPDGLPITINLEQADDGSISGSFAMDMMNFETDISNASYDEGSGELTFEFAGRGGDTVSVVATISGSAIDGELISDRFGGEFSGGRGMEFADADVDDEDFTMPPDKLVFPLGAYGLAAAPQPQDVLITNATIWTCGDAGIIRHAWMLVQNGRITALGGPDDPFPILEVDFAMDLGGKHITPGLIDCHSHTGINGSVNEFAQVNTAEVRIGDVINPDDINWYRQLAGGLTAANQLHGSANPIGGQNSVVKLKWGGSADDFRVDDAIGGIKFALGENVKRSTTRYPNTRMGVETSIRDAFTAAKDYKAEWDRYLALSEDNRVRTMPPQRDLELDTLVEILEGDRIIHCHSYRQDEILMLIRLADEFGFTIGTFQHILEGYKVADAIAEHGAGASSFSDWWAYKVEVMDAIPYNGAMMHDVDIVVSFNSDSSELARRMNTEASKAVRYGGVDPHEALKFVTLNPAKQLRIDHRTGSLEVGKDADFVVWSDDPLSTYARCEQTWIEGARYFDLEDDLALRTEVRGERQRLIQKILARTHGQPTGPAEESPSAAESGVDTQPTHTQFTDAQIRWLEEQVRLGLDPEQLRPGDCGCGWMHTGGQH